MTQKSLHKQDESIPLTAADHLATIESLAEQAGLDGLQGLQDACLLLVEALGEWGDSDASLDAELASLLAVWPSLVDAYRLIPLAATAEIVRFLRHPKLKLMLADEEFALVEKMLLEDAEKRPQALPGESEVSQYGTASQTMRGSPMSDQPEPLDLPILVLDFDTRNPRFMDAFGSKAQPDVEAIERMLDEENIHELVGSIGQRGYFPGEPLLVTPNTQQAGRYTVVEGNRRLAALRLLTGMIPAENLSPSLVRAIQQADRRPSHVACLCFPQRNAILRYLGFRHISGPRRWEPLSKARYLADLIATFYPDLPLDQQLRVVAKDIGSRKDYAAQLLTALKVYDVAKQRKYFGLQHVSEKDISFSLITTALSYRDIVDFLGLASREDCTAGNLNEDRLKELFAWMFAQDQQGDTILGESRKLRLLAAVVSSDIALAELRKTGDLDRAYVYTSGPAEALTHLLDEAAMQLSECSEMVIGDVSPDDSHLAQIDRILKVTDNLQLLIQRGIQQRRRRELPGHG